MEKMHDWTLVSVKLEWQSACASVEFEDSDAKKRVLVANQVRLLEVPRKEEWGSSISVNEALQEIGPLGVGMMIRVEMQSGDVICIWADNFEMVRT